MLLRAPPGGGALASMVGPRVDASAPSSDAGEWVGSLRAWVTIMRTAPVCSTEDAWLSFSRCR